MCQQLPAVEVHPAYVFDCAECGVENLVRSVCMDLSEEEKIEACDLFGYEVWDESDIRVAPEEVECSNCGAKFQVLYPGED